MVEVQAPADEIDPDDEPCRGRRCATRFVPRRAPRIRPRRSSAIRRRMPPRRRNSAAFARRVASPRDGRARRPSIDLMHGIHDGFTFDPAATIDRHAGDARARRAPRRLPGLRAPAHRAAAIARAGRALCQRISADRSAAGAAAAGRRRRVARLARRLVSGARVGRSRSDQRRAADRSATSPSPGDATTATSARCAAWCSAVRSTG